MATAFVTILIGLKCYRYFLFGNAVVSYEILN